MMRLPMSDLDAETIATGALDIETLRVMVYVLRRLLKEARAEEGVLIDKVKWLEEERKVDREQEDYRPRRENW